MIESGSSLPNLTDPAATTGAAEAVAFKAYPFSRRGPCRARRAGSTLLLALSNIRVAPKATSGGTTRRPPCAAKQSRFADASLRPAPTSATPKRSAPSVIPSPVHIRRHAEPVAKRDRLQDLDIAVLGAALTPIELECRSLSAGKGLQEDVMIGRIVGDHAPRQARLAPLAWV